MCYLLLCVCFVFYKLRSDLKFMNVWSSLFLVLAPHLKNSDRRAGMTPGPPGFRDLLTLQTDGLKLPVCLLMSATRQTLKEQICGLHGQQRPVPDVRTACPHGRPGSCSTETCLSQTSGCSFSSLRSFCMIGNLNLRAGGSFYCFR